MMQPITKYTDQIVSGDNIPSRVREAFRLTRWEIEARVGMVDVVVIPNHAEGHYELRELMAELPVVVVSSVVGLSVVASPAVVLTVPVVTGPEVVTPAVPGVVCPDALVVVVVTASLSLVSIPLSPQARASAPNKPRKSAP